MAWRVKKETPTPPKTQYIVTVGPEGNPDAYLKVYQSKDTFSDKMLTRRHLCVHFCQSTDAPIANALQTWPAEGIAEARRVLDELEAAAKEEADGEE